MTGLSNEIVATTASHEDLRALGAMWALMMDHEKCFISDVAQADFQVGKSINITKGIFTKPNRN